MELDYRLVQLGVLLLLVACAQPVVQEQPVVPQQAEPPLPIVQEHQIELPVKTVRQITPEGTTFYGLSDDNRILRIESPDSVWEYVYDDGVLKEIRGPKPVEFLYMQDKLESVDRGAIKHHFKYDNLDRLTEVTTSDLSYYIEYDSAGHISTIRKGVGAQTVFMYRGDDISAFMKGPIETKIAYDDKERARDFDAGEVQLILGYWRDNKLISLTGKTFGQGLTVNYGPDFNPTEAKIIAEADQSTFTAPEKEALYAVVDTYLYCKYVRRLPDLLFEGISFTFYKNYFNKDAAAYFTKQFMCIPL